MRFTSRQWRGNLTVESMERDPGKGELQEGYREYFKSTSTKAHAIQAVKSRRESSCQAKSCSEPIH